MKNPRFLHNGLFSSVKKPYIYLKNLLKKDGDDPSATASADGSFKKRRISPALARFVAVLLLFVLLPSALGCITTGVAIHSAQVQAVEKANHAVDYIQSSVDVGMKHVVEYVLAAANNPSLLELSKKPYSKEFVYDAALYDFFPENAPAAMSNLIYNQAVFISDSETILSENNVYHLSSFFEEILQTNDISAEELRKIIKDTSSRKILPAKSYSLPNKSKLGNCILFVQPFPLSSAPRGNILVFINCDVLFSSQIKKFNNDTSCFFIAGPSGEIVYSTGNSGYISPDLIYTEKNSGSLKVNSSPLLFSKKDSTYGNLKYIYTENAGAVSKAVFPLLFITIACVLLVIFAGGPLVIRLAKKNLAPIHEINELLKTSYSAEGNNELDNIQSAVKNILDEKLKSLPILEAGERSIRKELLFSLITGEFNSADSVRKACESNGISFVSDDFCVIHFNLNEIVKNDMPIIKYAISNTVSEIFEPISSIYIYDTEPSSLTGIVNLKIVGEDTEEQIISHLEFLRNFFTEHFSASIHVGVGSIVSGVEGISSSYSNAKDAAEYSVLTGSSDVLPYSRIRNKDYYYFYPLETESKLVSSVINGDVEQVNQIIDHVVEANSMLSFDMYKCLFFDLTATALKIMSHKTIDVSFIFDDDSSPATRLTGCKTLKELVETIHDIFDKICEHTRGGQGVRKEKLKASILEFIHKNFANPNMSLAMVADEFSMNYTYMSHFFKDFIGMNFIDYVSDLRVKKASELLRTTNMSISDIAFSVGYANSTVLIKIFKKVTNTTPGAYRRNIN